MDDAGRQLVDGKSWLGSRRGLPVPIKSGEGGYQGFRELLHPEKRFLTENMGKARRIADDRFQELLIVEAKWLKTELQPFLKKFFAPKLQSSEQSIR